MLQDANGDYLKQVVIDKALDSAIEQIETRIAPLHRHIFRIDDFLIEHTKEVIAQAYVAYENIHYIIIATPKINAVSQNALLKIIEEPPHNIRFILVVPQKTILLPTILSRMPLFKAQYSPTVPPPLTFAVDRLDTAQIYALIKEHERTSRGEIKILIQRIFVEATRLGLAQKPQILKAFEHAIEVLELNANVSTVLLSTLLHLVKR
ncbi:MAG: hypothetical protein KU37_04675 [Sulfuricurvum sp. PC08-66]|nr:MAG: hypothetical protein KU37_04675 [Sulfuricurvum sp. PC08-66]